MDMEDSWPAQVRKPDGSPAKEFTEFREDITANGPPNNSVKVDLLTPALETINNVHPETAVRSWSIEQLQNVLGGMSEAQKQLYEVISALSDWDAEARSILLAIAREMNPQMDAQNAPMKKEMPRG
jgi:deoxyribodipyrimidine photolyase